MGKELFALCLSFSIIVEERSPSRPSISVIIPISSCSSYIERDENIPVAINSDSDTRLGIYFTFNLIAGEVKLHVARLKALE